MIHTFQYNTFTGLAHFEVTLLRWDVEQRLCWRHILLKFQYKKIKIWENSLVFPKRECVYQVDSPSVSHHIYHRGLKDVSEKLSQSSSCLNGKEGYWARLTETITGPEDCSFTLFVLDHPVFWLSLLLALSFCHGAANYEQTHMTHPWHCPNTLLYFKHWWKKCSFYPPLSTFSLFTPEKGWKHYALIKCQWNTPLLSQLCLDRQRCWFDLEVIFKAMICSF